MTATPRPDRAPRWLPKRRPPCTGPTSSGRGSTRAADRAQPPRLLWKVRRALERPRPSPAGWCISAVGTTSTPWTARRAGRYGGSRRASGLPGRLGLGWSTSAATTAISTRWTAPADGSYGSSRRTRPRLLPGCLGGGGLLRQCGRLLYALDAQSGQERWKFETGASIGFSPAVSDGVVYFGNDAGRLYALDVRSGQERWKFRTGGGLYAWGAR